MPVSPQLAHIHDRTKPIPRVKDILIFLKSNTHAVYFCNLVLELLFGAALENLVGTVWAQQVPKGKSWGLYLAVYFSKLASKLMFKVVLKNLVEAVSAQHGP